MQALAAREGISSGRIIAIIPFAIGSIRRMLSGVKRIPSRTFAPQQTVSTLYGVDRTMRLKRRFIDRLNTKVNINFITNLLESSKSPGLWAYGMYFGFLSSTEQDLVIHQLSAKCRLALSGIWDIFAKPGAYFYQQYFPHIELGIATPRDDSSVDRTLQQSFFGKAQAEHVVSYAIRPDHDSSVATLIDFLINGIVDGKSFDKRINPPGLYYGRLDETPTIFIVVADNKKSYPSEQDHLAYIVPDRIQKNLVLYALRRAAEEGLISDFIREQAGKKVRTYKEFLTAPSLTTPLQPQEIHPERLGPYTLLRHVGQGGWGIVYEALDPNHGNRHVAIKVDNADPKVEAGVEANDTLQHERDILAALSSDPGAKDYVPEFYGSGRDEANNLYVAQEYLNTYISLDRYKTTVLETYFAEEQMERTLLIIEASAKALSAVHRAGYIHADVKPENIFVRETPTGYQVKFTDFGLAVSQHQESPKGRGLTELYASPEQTKNERISPQSDVFSLAVSLLSFVIDPKVFQRTRGLLTLEYLKHSLHEFPIPDALQALIDEATQEEWQQRPTADQFASSLATLRAA